MTHFFSGHQSPFSNFHRAPVDDPLTGQWPTSEHAFMARKAWQFGDETALERLRSASQPQQAKAIGRTVRGFNEQRWTQVREQHMRAVLLAKFSAQPATLLRVQDDFAEASPWDRIWGIGLSAEQARTTPQARWGQNLLGKALGMVRQALERPDVPTDRHLPFPDLNATTLNPFGYLASGDQELTPAALRSPTAQRPLTEDERQRVINRISTLLR